ncbi:MAG TPA: hypothetical protein ENL21_06685 [Caldithrix abyssi]|uniref:DUF1841 family protein n=1 Tax=Caldithrix abyssi TaxID=187145 RepID=A0A7V5LJF6_CALAY|nr:hypothetical protein [Caldisericaceae bacterium]HHE55451.1 hypothetical protein [Caldithrix abyssi]
MDFDSEFKAFEYDPNQPLDVEAWLKLDEMERILVVEDYHKQARVKLPDVHLHAVFHAAIENQIAEGLEDVIEALERLQFQGLDRHEAIHAIASVLLEQISDVMENPEPFIILGPPNYAYLQEVRKLTKRSWYRKYGKKRRRRG